MSHRALISGTAYELTGGSTLSAGTKFQIGGGKTIIGGTAYDIPFTNGVQLSTITPGAILYLNESGNPVPFYIAKHDYESGLNGAGRTLIVRKDCYDERVFSNSTNAYANGALDSWLCNTYVNLLDADIQDEIGTTKFRYTLGNKNTSMATLQREVFQLSLTELGIVISFANTEGSALPIANALQIAHKNGRVFAQWTRTPYKSNSDSVYYLNTGGSATTKSCISTSGSRPAFTLPGKLGVVPNADGTYSVST